MRVGVTGSGSVDKSLQPWKGAGIRDPGRTPGPSALEHHQALRLNRLAGEDGNADGLPERARMVVLCPSGRAAWLAGVSWRKPA